MFACFLDATKAFDVINHKTLFNRLLERKFPLHLTPFPLSWYKDQRMRVRWQNSFSDSFPISNGVRQGGVLSPILFTDDLHKLGVCCFCDSLFARALGYADDVVLLAPSPAALRMMLRCCEKFACNRGLRFNPSKTQLIRFSRSPSSTCTDYFVFCGQQLSFLDTVTHLGHLIHYNLSDAPDINHKLRDMVKKANCLLASFPKAGPAIPTRLFQSYCLPLYGSALWSLSCSALYHIEVTFNKILRRIWHLPNRSHTGIVHSVAKLDSLYNLVYRRSNSLVFTALRCPPVLVRSIFIQSVTTCYSFCGYNYLYGDFIIFNLLYYTFVVVCVIYNNNNNNNNSVVVWSCYNMNQFVQTSPSHEPHGISPLRCVQ